MAAQQNFRTAFNGFNRDDVVRYIEYLNSKHVAEINQLNSELDFLRSRRDEQPETPAPAPANDELIEQQAGRIRELFDENKALKAQIETAASEKAEQDAALAALQEENQNYAAQLEEAAQQQTSFKSHVEAELEAYRRAEQTERMARERSEQLYRQANGALADATMKVDDAACQISHLTDRVMSQLGELQTAVTSSKQALRDAAATMYTIRPTKDQKTV